MKRSGFTLVELLVAIALFSIVVAIASTGFVNALRTQRQVASLISTESNVTLVLEQMAREVRTGYLFCHDYGANGANVVGSPSANCADPPGSTDLTQQCTVTDSGQPAGDAPTEDVYQGNSKGDLAEWNCPSIDYYNGEAAHVNYSLQNGALMKKDSSAGNTAQSITGGDVSVKYLHFILFGNLEGDHWTPRITISIGVAPSSTDPAVSSDVLNLQTTISARQIDCDTSGTLSSC